jgi:hypothetical protein
MKPLAFRRPARSTPALAEPSWLAWAFTLANSVRALFYLPQILAVARSVDGARDIALATWVMWTVTNLLGTGYALEVARDTLLALSFAASACACLLTILLTLVKRSQWRNGRGRASGAVP